MADTATDDVLSLLADFHVRDGMSRDEFVMLNLIAGFASIERSSAAWDRAYREWTE